MPRLNVKLSEDKGEPLLPPGDSPTSAELAALAQHGGAFDWLADEPELYTLSDGEPV